MPSACSATSRLPAPGLGTFPVVYPQFRSFYTNFFVNEAHNDYLQLLAEMGLLGFGTMVWFVVVLYRSALRKIGNWMTDVPGAVTLACMISATGILLHDWSCAKAAAEITQ